MSKRKKTLKTIRKKVEELRTIFDCPFCFITNSVTVKKQKIKNIAMIICGYCNISYKTNYTDPIDIYFEWIDACEEINKKGSCENKELSNESNSEDEKLKNKIKI